ncbi:hypothetical protein ADUPG1_007987 [Aduncisulcus paluster]|uniref:Prp19 coiled-coil region domain-containing protein n=1 Tax=Aduncisulcus paluster TaxID=2918883 RepID=A0ABQ5KSV6_9EUKA|nr:hypothetical protein ADUPG1_007987 [Aduncisulcus paluster]
MEGKEPFVDYLDKLKERFDDIKHENYVLLQKLQEKTQALSKSVKYQEAATTVIERISKERDASIKMLDKLRKAMLELDPSFSQSAEKSDEKSPATYEELPFSILETIKEERAHLFSLRSTRGKMVFSAAQQIISKDEMTTGYYSSIFSDKISDIIDVLWVDDSSFIILHLLGIEVYSIDKSDKSDSFLISRASFVSFPSEFVPIAAVVVGGAGKCFSVCGDNGKILVFRNCTYMSDLVQNLSINEWDLWYSFQLSLPSTEIPSDSVVSKEEEEEKEEEETSRSKLLRVRLISHPSLPIFFISTPSIILVHCVGPQRSTYTHPYISHRADSPMCFHSDGLLFMIADKGENETDQTHGHLTVTDLFTGVENVFKTAQPIQGISMSGNGYIVCVQHESGVSLIDLRGIKSTKVEFFPLRDVSITGQSSWDSWGKYYFSPLVQTDHSDSSKPMVHVSSSLKDRTSRAGFKLEKQCEIDLPESLGRVVRISTHKWGRILVCGCSNGISVFELGSKQ